MVEGDDDNDVVGGVDLSHVSVGPKSRVVPPLSYHVLLTL